MIFTIHKGTHRAQPLYWLYWFLFLFNRTEIKRRVCFTDAKYWLDGGDQEDWNKLFGISFHLSPHINSARFGWRYNFHTNKFQLCAYCYLNGERIVEELCDFNPQTDYDCHLIITKDDYRFRVYRKMDMAVLCSEEISKGHNRKNGYLLGPYFGGNRKSPEKLKFTLKKFK